MSAEREPDFSDFSQEFPDPEREQQIEYWQNRAERIEKARQRLAHAEHMLEVCSEFSVGTWSELVEDTREFLADLESQVDK